MCFCCKNNGSCDSLFVTELLKNSLTNWSKFITQVHPQIEHKYHSSVGGLRSRGVFYFKNSNSFNYDIINMMSAKNSIHFSHGQLKWSFKKVRGIKLDEIKLHNSLCMYSSAQLTKSREIIFIVARRDYFYCSSRESIECDLLLMNTHTLCRLN